MNKKLIALSRAALLAAALAVGALAQGLSTINAQLPQPGKAHAPANSPVAKHGQLSVSDNTIVDESGTAVVLRGMSLFWSNSEHYTWYKDDVVGWLVHDWKISVIRAAMGVWNETGGGGNTGYADGDSATQVGHVKLIVEAAIKRGIYVIIDWHTHDASRYTSKAETFFSNMAKEYGAYPNIIYETYNEPTGNMSDVVTYSDKVTKKIREHDANNIIVIGSPGHSSQPYQTPAASGTNLAYAMHFYAVSHTNSYEDNMTQALNLNRAVFATEWGTTHYDGGSGGQDATISTENSDKWITLMENKKVSWVNWNVSNKNEASSVFKTTTSAGGSSSWGQGTRPDLTSSGTYIRGKITSGNSGYFGSNPTYTITTSTEGQGTITRSQAGPSYSYNQSVTLTAVPDDGWIFEGWAEDARGTAPTLNARMVGVNLKVKAVFAQGSMITNGTFTNGLTSWSGTNTTRSSDSFDGGVMKVEVTNATTARVTQSGLNLQDKKEYELSFRARAVSGSGSVTPRITNSNRNIDYIVPSEAEALTTTWETITRRFVKCGADANAVLMLDCPGSFTWYLDDVKLDEVGAAPQNACQTSVFPGTVSALRNWSIVRSGGVVTLRGPAEAGTKVQLFDTRGKMVRNLDAKDGMTLGKNIPAGNYLLLVKNAAGKEVLKNRVSLVK